MKGRRIGRSLKLQAPPARVWAAWTDPERIAGWFVERAEGEARAGGTVRWIWEKFGCAQTVRVLEALPGERLVLADERGHVQEITLMRSHGATVLRLVHSGFGEDAGEEYEGIESGWTVALQWLQQYVERHFGEPRRLFLALRPVTHDPAAARALFREEGLRRWLTTSGRLGDGLAALRLQEGGTLTGSVLASTPFDVSVTWEEVNGVVAFKTFPTGPGRRAVAIDGCGWGLSADRAAALEQSLGRAVDRLVAALETAPRAAG
jgi:uncharacterized protein YndB with AHSA1/START domain